jgi:glycosyltransferase involved in cell wall biosynthesis
MVIQSFLPVLGGAQRQVDLLGPLLARQGVELTVVTRRPPGTLRRELRPGLDVRRMPGPDRGGLGSIAYTAAGTVSLARLRPDVVHVHDLLSPSTIALLSRPAVRAPVVAKVLSTGPGGDLDRLLRKPLGKLRLRAMARSFAAFVCLSDEVAAELSAHGVEEGRLRRIPNGVDAGRFRPATGDERMAERARLGLGGEGVLALYAGRFGPVKRLHLLVEAVAMTPGVRLAMVGEGSEEQRLRQLVEERGLADRVTLLGLTEDTAPLYRAADLYVSVSSTEGMSNSVLEAMASGLPVVTAAASGMGELVTAATGVLVEDPEDIPSFAAALTEVAGDPEPRARLGAAARERVRADYSLESVSLRLRDLYDEVLSASKRNGRAAL